MCLRSHLGQTCSLLIFWSVARQKTQALRLGLESVTDNRDKDPIQKTVPKRGKPAEIPVPKRGAVMRDLGKVARKRPPKR
jgi:hypothetical protein